MDGECSVGLCRGLLLREAGANWWVAVRKLLGMYTHFESVGVIYCLRQRHFLHIYCVSDLGLFTLV